MVRYIDAEELLTKMSNDLPYKGSVKRILIQAPTADVVEVKHGEWRGEMKECCDWRKRPYQHFYPNCCSVCHKGVEERTPYCPNCGAKMDGGKKL